MALYQALKTKNKQKVGTSNWTAYIIIHLFIPYDRDFYTKPITLIILIKPFRK